MEMKRRGRGVDRWDVDLAESVGSGTTGVKSRGPTRRGERVPPHFRSGRNVDLFP